MTTLNTICKEHKPMLSAISNIGDAQYTFCQDCEQNIDRFYIHDDYDRLPFFTDWSITK